MRLGFTFGASSGSGWKMICISLRMGRSCSPRRVHRWKNLLRTDERAWLVAQFGSGGGLVHFHRTPPFGMKPGEYSQGTDLDRAWRHDPHAPEIGRVDGG